ncbi:hypothetical protein CRUP_019898 [Coryphaenoides rupestris]|nr:hypothetical protein CRUP_019898 [Coryphaenoides rupestris]
MPLAMDFLHPSPELQKRTHKKKRLVQSPNSYFMDVKCPGHAQTVRLFVLGWWQSSQDPREGRLASQKGVPSDENSTNVPALAVLGDRYQAPAKQHCPGQTEQEDTEGGKPADELRWRRLALQQLYDGFLSTLYKGNFGLSYQFTQTPAQDVARLHRGSCWLLLLRYLET